MKISKRVKADFEFYLNNPLDMIGHIVGVEIIPDVKGYSALECFYAHGTHGKRLPCREPEILSKAIRGKKSANLQMEHWAESLFDGGPHKILLSTIRQPELFDYCIGYPRWVFKGVIEQAGKLAMQSIGFAPRFTRYETFRGNWWAPEMDSFDPSI